MTAVPELVSTDFNPAPITLFKRSASIQLSRQARFAGKSEALMNVDFLESI